MRFLKRKRGFSLIECLIVLAILALLFNFAVPSWQAFFYHAHDQSHLAELERALRFAQQEALLRGQRVTLCASRNQQSCSADWSDGFLLVSEEQAGEQNRLRVFEWQEGEGELHFRAFPRHEPHCQFLPTGASNHENGTFWYCRAHKAVWALMLGQTGHWRTQFPNRQGQLQDEHAQILPC